MVKKKETNINKNEMKKFKKLMKDANTVHLTFVDSDTGERYNEHSIAISRQEVQKLLPIFKDEMQKVFPDENDRPIRLTIEILDKHKNDLSGHEVFDMVYLYKYFKLLDETSGIEPAKVTNEFIYSETIMQLMRMLIVKSGITKKDIKEHIARYPVISKSNPYPKRNNDFINKLNEIKKNTKSAIKTFQDNEIENMAQETVKKFIEENQK